MPWAIIENDQAVTIHTSQDWNSAMRTSLGERSELKPSAKLWKIAQTLSFRLSESTGMRRTTASNKSRVFLNSIMMLPVSSTSPASDNPRMMSLSAPGESTCPSRHSKATAWSKLMSSGASAASESSTTMSSTRSTNTVEKPVVKGTFSVFVRARGRRNSPMRAGSRPLKPKPIIMGPKSDHRPMRRYGDSSTCQRHARMMKLAHARTRQGIAQSQFMALRAAHSSDSSMARSAYQMASTLMARPTSVVTILVLFMGRGALALVGRRVA